MNIVLLQIILLTIAGLYLIFFNIITSHSVLCNVPLFQSYSYTLELSFNFRIMSF